MAGHGWYPPSSSHYPTQHQNHPQVHPHQHQQQTQYQQHGQYAADTVQQDARRLVAAYPLANVTPTDHVARHLSSLTVSARAPSYINPGYYTHHPSTNAPPPPYSEYAPEMQHLHSHHVPPSHEDAYWSRTRTDAVGLLGHQPQYPSYADYQPTTQYWSSSHPTAQFRPSALGHSLLTHSFPHTSYPTPPPPMHPSSSSLANALGPPPPPITPVPPPQLRQAQAPPPPSAQQQQEQQQPYAPPPQQHLPPHPPLQYSYPTQHQQPAHLTQQQDQRMYLAAPLQQQQQPIYHAPQAQVLPARSPPKPQDQAKFFNAFLSSTSREIERSRAAKFATMPTLSAHSRSSLANVFQQPQAPSSSPLSVLPSSPAPSSPVKDAQTPQKRKASDVEDIRAPLQSPAVKRIQTLNRVASTPSFSKNSRRSQMPSSAGMDTPISTRGPHSSVLNTPSSRLDTPSSARGPPSSVVNTPSSVANTPSSLPDKRSRSPSASRSPTVARKVRHTAFVQLPAPKFKVSLLNGSKTPAKKSVKNGDEKMDIDHDEDGSGEGTDEDGEDYLPRVTSLPRTEKPKGTGKKAGEKDERDTIEKLTTLFDDIFEAEDTLPIDATPSSLPHPFTTLSPDARTPCLSPSTLTKLTQRIAAAASVARPRAKRGSPVKKRSDGPTRLAELDRNVLSRVLKVLERSLQAAENIDPFVPAPNALGPSTPSKHASPSKKPKKSADRRSTSRTPEDDFDTEKAVRQFELARNGVLAAGAAIALLAGDRLPRAAYSEELIASCVAVTRSALEHIVYPLTENPSRSVLLPKHLPAEVLQALLGTLPVLDKLVRAETVAMSDSIVISMIYVSIGPFFAAEAEGEREGQRGKKERDLFAVLPNGGAIRVVSALLLQLVQTSTHSVRIYARKLARSRQQDLTTSATSLESDGGLVGNSDREEIELYLSGLESATKSAKTIVAYLTQRSGKSKTTKNSNEAEYRAIFDGLLQDLLTVLFMPEWPAASLVLGIACKFLVNSLEDVRTNNTVENNAVKSIALDHLGAVAARLRGSILRFQGTKEAPKEDALRSLDEILKSRDTERLERLIAAHQDVSAHLARRSSEEQSFESARELTAVIWGQELAAALKSLDAQLEGGTGPDLVFARRIKTALRDVWVDAVHDVFSDGGDENAQGLATAIGLVQGLRNSFTPILNVILSALEAPPVFMRTKALKALGSIVTTDPTILNKDNVRESIKRHLQDNSAAVREAAVGLIGEYMISTPSVAGEYFPVIATRTADLGLAVRKRVIKLLRAFYGITTDRTQRIDICTKLVMRLNDEDDGVKDLALKTLEELWFPTAGTKPDLLTKVVSILGVAAHFRERQNPLEDMLHKIAAGKTGADADEVNRQYSEVCEVLIDGLVDATSIPGFTVINCIRTIYLFASAHPRVLTASNASTLLPYLKSSSAIMEEQVIGDYLLKIFRVVVPHMPKTATKFATELQATLQPMILKPSVNGGLTTLQESIACLCVVVLHLTNEFKQLSKLLVGCFNKVLQFTQQEAAGKPVNDRARNVLWYIVALLCENCDFDKLRAEHPDDVAELARISTESIIQRIYQQYLHLYARYPESNERGRILACLGSLFRAHPTLMTLDSSATIMDTVFSQGSEEDRTRLLRLMQDFLVSESEKHAAKEKGKEQEGNKANATGDVDMEELIGNTDGFADSGVASAIVQRYLEPVLDAALAQHAQMQNVASFPVIVALETSPNSQLAQRANGLHSLLHTKHASLLNSRYAHCARKTYEYQQKLATSSAPLCGYRPRDGGVPTALLQRWYGHVREKRAPKMDFLKALVRTLEPPATLEVTQDDVGFVRYMAENFATMEYKLVEEVLHIVKLLTSVLSTLGMQCMHALQPEGLACLLDAPLPVVGENAEMASAPAQQEQQRETNAPWQSPDKLPLLRSSVVLGIIMLLKAHLKALYGLSEDKILKYVPGKKSAVGDRAATRRQGASVAIAWDRMPHALEPVVTSEDMRAQRDAFLAVWHADGVTEEPEEDIL
ncbi:hypothetical protein K488DRAFT_83792 [Vararia minispora EC-137]|uniref:Uncharacterized protein n=1 Tax=Vararia minispora EC-137 TaxID=1314806 RepID=A0ACB8QSF0_9AGAM|nr:hypothetical protein K488DRAFT_83792 [Vararia minispora EC-137]